MQLLKTTVVVWIWSCLGTEPGSARPQVCAAAVEMSHDLLKGHKHTGLAPGDAPWVIINAITCTCPPGVPELAACPTAPAKKHSLWGNHSVSRTWISLPRMQKRRNGKKLTCLVKDF